MDWGWKRTGWGRIFFKSFARLFEKCDPAEFGWCFLDSGAVLRELADKQVELADNRLELADKLVDLADKLLNLADKLPNCEFSPSLLGFLRLNKAKYN